MNFKLADITDINMLIDFRKRQLIDEGQVPNLNIDCELRNYFSSMLADEKSVIWTAVKNNETVAVGCVYFFQYPPSFKNATGQVAYIHSMYTIDEYRGHGIASHILSLIINETKARGCKVIQLQASEQGKPVYKKIGFVETDGYMIMRL